MSDLHLELAQTNIVKPNSRIATNFVEVTTDRWSVRRNFDRIIGAALGGAGVVELGNGDTKAAAACLATAVMFGAHSLIMDSIATSPQYEEQLASPFIPAQRTPEE